MSYWFPPNNTPTATRAGAMLRYLSQEWDVTVVTEAPDSCCQGMEVWRVPPATAQRALWALRRRLRLRKMVSWLVWPDEQVFWVLPALRKAKRLHREKGFDAVAVFMMPHSSGLVGVLLKRRTGVALLLSNDDSPTCPDLHPIHPSRLHYRLARSLEALYGRSADAGVYVSERTLQRASAPWPEGARRRFRCVRHGVDVEEWSDPGEGPEPDVLRIVYTGGMSWGALLEPDARWKKLYQRWVAWGTHVTAQHDHRAHTPLHLARAVREVLARHPAWAGRLRIDVYEGSPYPRSLLNAALIRYRLEELVHVHEGLSHVDVAGVQHRAGILFLALPERLDGEEACRISCKTYEYLATDRPILAAVPRGENWDYLEGQPGVNLVEPGDFAAMAKAIERVAEEHFSGRTTAMDRSALRPALDNRGKARAFDEALRSAVSRSRGPAEETKATA